jgi:sugar/nucleoside kinase (ribokinase family)
MGLDLAACGRLASACAAAIIAQYGARPEQPLLPLLDRVATAA